MQYMQGLASCHRVLHLAPCALATSKPEFRGSPADYSVLVYVQLRKVPMLRDPWEHVLLIGIGAYCGDWLTKYEERTAKEVDEILRKRAEKNQNITGEEYRRRVS